MNLAIFHDCRATAEGPLYRADFSLEPLILAAETALPCYTIRRFDEEVSATS